MLYNWSWQSYNGAVLKKLNVHGLIWLGNDTVSLWHGTSVSITVDQCLRKRKFDKEKERFVNIHCAVL